MTSKIQTYTLNELDKIVDALQGAKPDGRIVVAFPEVRANFRAQIINRGSIESDFVWCYGALDIKKGKNDIYTLLGTVADRDAFSFVTQIKEWKALPFPPEPTLAGFRNRAPEGAQAYLGDVILTPYKR